MITEVRSRRNRSVRSVPKSLRTASGAPLIAVSDRPNVALPPNAQLHYAAREVQIRHTTEAWDNQEEKTHSIPVAPRVRRVQVLVKWARSILQFRLSRYLKGDSLVIGTFLSCATIVCVVGIAYLAVFANVQYLSVHLRTEQNKLAAAVALKHDLQDQIGRLSSPDLISAIAPQMNMELPPNHAYVDVPASTSFVPAHMTEMAAAN